jgi:hypothetical protein
MSSETKYTLSKNTLRRLHGWAKAVYPNDWPDRCAVITEYLAQLDPEAAATLVRAEWAAVLAAAERDWPEAFAGWKQESGETA